VLKENKEREVREEKEDYRVSKEDKVMLFIKEKREIKVKKVK
jgi:hypothetical protein